MGFGSGFSGTTPAPQLSFSATTYQVDMLREIEVGRFFWVGLAASVVGLSVASWLSSKALVVFAFGMVPLVAYHLRLLSDVGKGLSQTTIDTVYYFGFIVTIATLAATVLFIATRGIASRDLIYVA